MRRVIAVYAGDSTWHTVQKKQQGQFQMLSADFSFKADLESKNYQWQFGRPDI